MNKLLCVTRKCCSPCNMMFSPGFKSRYSKLIKELPLTRFEKEIINKRYIHLVTSAENDYRITCFLYIFLTNIITISGVFITALLTLEKLDMIDSRTSNAFFWITWTLSIILTLANKWIYVFNINKKYILGIVTLEKLYTEGWSFMTGIGKYSKYEDEEKFKVFCSRIEKIKMKSIESLPEIGMSETANDILAMSHRMDVENAENEPNTVDTNTAQLTIE